MINKNIYIAWFIPSFFKLVYSEITLYVEHLSKNPWNTPFREKNLEDPESKESTVKAFLTMPIREDLATSSFASLLCNI